ALRQRFRSKIPRRAGTAVLAGVALPDFPTGPVFLESAVVVFCRGCAMGNAPDVPAIISAAPRVALLIASTRRAWKIPKVSQAVYLLPRNGATGAGRVYKRGEISFANRSFAISLLPNHSLPGLAQRGGR